MRISDWSSDVCSSDLVAALGKRKVAVEMGLYAGVSHTGVFTSAYDQVGFRMSASKDISGRHGSWTASPTIDYGGPLSKRAYLGVSASVNFYVKGFGRARKSVV